MNRVNQNNWLFSKSFFNDKQINHFLRIWHEMKTLFRSSSSIWNNELCHETQINHEMKKICFQIVFCRVCKLREKSYLSNVTLQWNHLSCFVYYLNQKKAKTNHFFSFLKHRQNDRSSNQIIFSTNKQVLKSNSIIILVFSSQFDQSVDVVSFFSVFSITKVNTSSIESISSISILSVLKRYFELCYRLDSFDFLNLLIMKCMKNVIDSQQILKSRSYKKTMNDFNRDEWLKIMKNENKFLLINEIWKLIIYFKIDEYFATNEFTRSKEKDMTKFCVTKRDEWFAISNK
jgi:hypothetical protein